MSLINQITGKLLQELGGGQKSTGSSTINGKGVGSSFGGSAVNLELSVSSLQRAFEDSALRLNGPSAAVGASTEILSTLLGMTDKLLKLAKRASSDSASADERATSNTKFQAVVAKFRELLDKSSAGGIDLRSKSDLAELLKNAGVDTGAATELAKFFNTIAPVDGELGYSKFKGENVTVSKVVTTTTFTAAGAGTLQAAASYAGATQSFSIRTADFNRDGKIDTVSSGLGPSGVLIHIGNGDGSFTAATTLSVPSTTFDVTVADFNRDGIADVAATVTPGTAPVGTGTLAAPVSYDIEVDIRAFATVDLNHDGVLDLVGGSGNEVISVALGNSDGSFAFAHSTAGSGGAINSLVYGDFDSDGNIDLVTGLDYGDGEFYRGVGDGTFFPVVNFSLDVSDGTHLQKADVDTDGDLDILVTDTTSSWFSVMLNDGSGSFTSAGTYDTADGAPVTAMLAADVNQDGITDLAISTSGPKGLQILLGNADGSFNSGIVYDVSIPSAFTKLVGGDFNRDGEFDLVGITAGTGQTLYTLLGNPDGSFKDPVSYYGGDNLVDVALADHNGDGALDIFTASSNGNVQFLSGNYYFGTFNNAATYASSAGTTALTIGDFNQDGQTDVATVGNNGVSEKIQILAGDPFVFSGGFQGAISYTGASGANDLHLVDVNHDGIKDALFSSNINKRYFVALGNADGSFSTASTRIAPEVQTASAVGDINGDGDVDLLLIVDGGSSFSLNPYLGTGTGTFTAGGSYDAVDINAMTLADVNHDGNLDLLTAHAAGSVSVYIGNGNGTFKSDVNYFTSGVGKSIDLADFDQDGNLDLVVGTDDDRLSILLGNANGTFKAEVLLNDSDLTSDLTIGDFNKDGSLDIATTSTNDDSIALFLGNGNGTFKHSTLIPGGTALENIESGDINRDGDLDLIVSDKASSTVGVLYGNGNGTFKARQTYITGASPQDLRVEDVDQNGLLDIVTISSTNGTISVNKAGTPYEIDLFLGVGNGTFNASTSIRAPYAVYMTTGDVNNDGISDLVTSDLVAKTGSIYLGNGDGTFQAQRSVALGGGFPASIGLKDFDRDGKLDLIATSDAGKILVSLGNGDGTFKAVKSYGILTSPYGMAFGDFDRDGITDVVTSSSADSNLKVFIANSNGSFSLPDTYAAGTNPYFVHVTDFNSDGFDDLISDSGAGTIDVFLGNGDGTFLARRSYTTNGVIDQIASGDLNGDGATDLLAAGITNGNIQILLGNSVSYTGSFQNRISSAASSAVNDIITADMNRDGILDIIASDGGVSISLGNGDGTFQARKPYAASGSATGVSVGDFNGDGILDVSTSSSTKVDVFLGNSNGTLQAAVSYGAYAGVVDIQTADINRDGKLDLVGRSSGSATFVALVGNGDGTFRAPVSYGNGITIGPGEVSLADINRDGILDVVNSSSVVSSVSVAFGNSDGSFNAAVSYTTSGVNSSFVLKDLNADGVLDLVSSNNTQDRVSVLLGNTNGSFKASVSYFAGDTPADVSAADTNGDGIVDLVVAASGDSRYNVLLGNGNGTFQSVVSYYGGIGAQRVTFADVDRDGRADIVGYSASSATYDVLRSPGESGTTVTTSGLEVAIAGTNQDPLSQNLQTKGGATIAYNTLTKLQKDVLKDTKGIEGVLKELRGALRFAIAGSQASAQASNRITSYNDANHLAADVALRIRTLAQDPLISRHSELDRVLVAKLIKD